VVVKRVVCVGMEDAAFGAAIDCMGNVECHNHDHNDQQQ
jgi:hypothetical protein